MLPTSGDGMLKVQPASDLFWLSGIEQEESALVCESGTVWLNGNEHERAAYEVEDRDLRLARKLIQKYPLHRYERLAPLMRRLRAVKSPAEVTLLRRAVDITDAGLRRVLSVLKPGVMEYELEAECRSVLARRA
ncbi:MAG: hypothetical protein WD072_07725 [Pirellulales bacterium]